MLKIRELNTKQYLFCMSVAVCLSIAATQDIHAADYQTNKSDIKKNDKETSDESLEYDWIFDAEVNYQANSNVGRAERKRDIIEDKAQLLNLSLGLNIEFESEQAVTLRSIFETQRWQDVEDLSRDSLGLQFIYRWQNTLGYTAPFYQFNIAYQVDNYGVEQRDSGVMKSQLFFTKRLTDQTTITSGIEFQKHDSDGSVFDLEQSRFFINDDYNFNQDWTGYLSYSYADGDIWSSAQDVFCNGATATDIYGIISWATAIEEDVAFNNAFNNSNCADHWLAYRLSAVTQTFTLGLNVGLSHSLSIDVAATKVDVKADGSNQYDSQLMRASLLMRF